MSEELNTAAKWHLAWLRVLQRRSRKDCIRWQKRVVWALHRWERARRALLPEGPKCWFCERPGHDESEEACLVRERVVGYWEVMGWIYNQREGA